MDISTTQARAQVARWDGSRMLFSIDVAGSKVACAISRGALEEMHGGRYLRVHDVMPCFTKNRLRIVEVAAAIFRIRPESVTGVVNIWADDISDPPAAPAMACMA